MKPALAAICLSLAACGGGGSGVEPPNEPELVEQAAYEPLPDLLVQVQDEYRGHGAAYLVWAHGNFQRK